MNQRKLNIGRIFVRFRPNRKHRDRLFRRIFEDKKDLLIYISMKNDTSFIISSTLNSYEHQSTFSPNMPIRGFLYFARLYEAHIKKLELNLYGKNLVKLPLPRFVVFYNGREEQPDELSLKLSDAFMPGAGDEEPALECRAKLLNINYGHNRELMKRCRRLHDYSYFVAKVNAYLDNGYPLREAMNKAVSHCIEKGILTDILTKCRDEVCNMLLTEFDEKLYARTLYNEGFEDGVESGMERGIEQSIAMLKSLNIPETEIVRLVAGQYQVPESKVSSILKKNI